jgi:putative redox protein
MGDTREVTVTHLEDASFVGRTPHGTEVTMGTANGERRGLSPMELVLAALGGCAGVDVVGILRKERQSVTGYEIRVRGERADEHPRVYRSIDVVHVLQGPNLSPAAVERAVRLSADKYCSVSAMLAAGSEVRHRFEIEAT